MINIKHKNLMALAKKAYREGNHKEALRNLLRLNHTKLDLIWEFETSMPITSLCAAKRTVRRKRVPQLIVGSEDNTVYSLSLKNELLWKFKANDEITSVKTYDLTNDLSQEIIIGSKDSNIYVLNSAGRLLWRYETQREIRCIDAVSFGRKRVIFTGTSEGDIDCIEFLDELLWKYSYRKRRAVTDLCVADLTKDGKMEIQQF